MDVRKFDNTDKSDCDGKCTPKSFTAKNTDWHASTTAGRYIGFVGDLCRTIRVTTITGEENRSRNVRTHTHVVNRPGQHVITRIRPESCPPGNPGNRTYLDRFRIYRARTRARDYNFGVKRIPNPKRTKKYKRCRRVKLKFASSKRRTDNGMYKTHQPAMKCFEYCCKCRVSHLRRRTRMRNINSSAFSFLNGVRRYRVARGACENGIIGRFRGRERRRDLCRFAGCAHLTQTGKPAWKGYGGRVKFWKIYLQVV